MLGLQGSNRFQGLPLPFGTILLIWPGGHDDALLLTEQLHYNPFAYARGCFVENGTVEDGHTGVKFRLGRKAVYDQITAAGR